ncbi:hypothetical protein AVME950_00250 [Acidovorax sp. SUPP950]|uniref:hypothetical protein n=1 Tax=Acidovorax sp. SUPP950 TaxID=511901 RepID=UPI0023BC304F|nr:hypothetical protein [Acidovorax sp. SUPP950]GKS73268.1 hypothetical protein AVME950_00250 [Acidovorax sp. SUPP950]
MADRRLAAWAMLAVVAAAAAGSAHAQPKTLADRSAEADVTLELMQKDRQIQDMLATDPILRQLPTVVSVVVLQGKRTARLAMPNGVVQTFEEGDEIADRMHLRSVALRMVRVMIQPLPNAKSRAPVSLPLQFHATRSPGVAGVPGGLPGMPGMTGAMGAMQVPGMPAAPLAIPPGLIQAPPALPISRPTAEQPMTAPRAESAQPAPGAPATSP